MKLFGIAFLFFSCVFTGFFVSSFYKKRVEQLEGFRDLIKFTASQIEGYLTPTHRIFALFQNMALQKSGFLTLLGSCGWEAAFKECRGRLFLTEREIFELTAFFSRLGNCDTDSAVRHCNYYITLLGEWASAARAELPGKIKLCRSLGLAAGVMLAVLFI